MKIVQIILSHDGKNIYGLGDNGTLYKLYKGYTDTSSRSLKWEVFLTSNDVKNNNEEIEKEIRK